MNWKHFLDCAIVCHFHPYDYTHMSEALSGVTGHEYSPRDILTVGERAQVLCRLFNLREGFTVEDDRLPERVMKAFKDGPLAGVEITQEAFLAARNYWYELMGWTPGRRAHGGACGNAGAEQFVGRSRGDDCVDVTADDSMQS